MTKECVGTKNLFLILSMLFTAQTFAGAIYVLVNHGTVNAGYAVIPMLFSLIFASFTRESQNKINKQKGE